MNVEEPQDAAPSHSWWMAAMLVAAVGVYYRVREVGSLHLILDERLVLRAAAHGSPLDALIQHTGGNNSPALTIFAQLLHRSGVLDELTLRLPMVAAGILLLALPPLFSARLGRPTALLYLALVASSAPLVYFSFVARPYAPALLAIGVGFVAWDRWCRTGARTPGALFGVASSVAVFFHAFAAPVVASLFAVGLLEAVRGRLSWKAWWHSVGWAAGVAALLLGPGAASFASVHSAKVGVGRFTADFPFTILERLTGSLGGTSGLLVLAVGVGLARGCRRDPRFGLAGCLAIASPAIALAIVRPLGGASDWARYVLMCWPIALLFGASGLAWAVTALAQAVQDRRFQAGVAVWAALGIALSATATTDSAAASGSWLRTAIAPFFSWGAAALLLAGVVERARGRGAGIAAAAVLLLIGSFALSPLRLYRQAPDSFRSHPDALAPLVPRDAPAFYARLAAESDAGDAVFECPDPGTLIHSAPYAGYQQWHRKRVLLLSPLPNDFRRGFRNLVDVESPAALRRADARYALVHRNLRTEFGAGDAPPLSRYSAHADRCRAALRASFGPPVYSDEVLDAFDVRAGNAASGAGHPGTR